MLSDFSSKLLGLRNAKNWTQEQLAEKCGVSRQAVTKWENSQNFPDIFKIAQLAELFDVSISELIPNNKKTNDINSCLIAIGKVFPLCFFANLTTNRYRMINYETWNSNIFNESGVFDEIVQTEVFKVPDKTEKIEFSRAFTRSNLIQMYKQGRKTISLKHKHKWEDNTVHWVETTVCFADNRLNNDVLCVIFGKIIDEEVEIKKEIVESKKQLIAREKIIKTLTSDYASTFLTNIDTGEIIYNLLDEELLKTITNKKELANNSQDPTLEDFYKKNIYPDDYENSIYNLKKETILEHFKTQKSYSFIYRFLVNDKYKYHITTIKKCDDYDVSHNYILAIRCIDDEIENNNEMLEKQQNILHNASDEIRNPLNVIMGMINLAQNTENRELINELLQVAINAGKDLNTAVNTFLHSASNEVVTPKNDYTQNIEQLKNKRALLCDDVIFNNLIVQEILKSIGIFSNAVSNGAEAIELIKSTEPGNFDFIVMDISMPVMDGIEATKQIRKLKDKRKANIPIIGLSAFDSEDDIAKAKNAGMNEYLLKPLNTGEFFRVLLKTLI